MWHLILGPQHTLVRNASVAAMTKLINKTFRSFECGCTFDTWLNSALGITLMQSTEFLVGGRLDVSIIEGCTEGIVVGCEDTGVGVGKGDKRDPKSWSFVSFK